MADAFRGLTLRLGADARPVVSAVNSIKKSAGQAQTQLNAMNKALRFDKGNVAAMEARLDLVGDKARLAARQAATIGTAMRQAAQRTVEFSSDVGVAGGRLDKVAANVRDAYAATQKLRSEQTHVNAELQHIYDGVKRIVAADYGVSFEKADKYVKQMQASLGKTTDKAKALQSELYEIVARIPKEQSATGDLFGLGKTKADGDRLVQTFKSLHEHSGRVADDLKKMNEVEGFRALRTQAIAARAELRQAASEAARFSSELHAMGQGGILAPSVSYIERMDGALEKATAEARQMRAMYDAMPRSVEAIKSRMTAAATAEATLKAKLESVRGAIAKIEAAPGFDKVAASSHTAYVEAMRVEQAYEDVTVKLRGAEAAAEGFKRDLATMRDEGVDETSADFVKLKSRIEAVDREVAKWKSRLASVDDQHAVASQIVKFRELKTAEAAAVTEVERLRASTSKLNIVSGLGNSLREFGYGLYSTLTPAIMMAGRYGIQAANDIDSAWRDMRKTVNGTEEEFQHLKDAALEFSQTHVTTAETILEIEAMGGQLGIAAQNLEGFSEVVSNLDIATDIDAEDLAKYIGQLSNIMKDINQYKDDPEQYQQKITALSDSLVRLGNNSAAQESSIMKVMMRIASLGTISGMSTPDLLAISTAVAATGQGCEAAGTAISKTFSNIESAVSAGGDKLQGFADVAGMSAEDFARSWTETPTQAFTAFIEGLKRIDEEGGSVDGTLTGLKITSVRQKQALMGLTNTLDVLHGSLQMSNDAWNGMSTAMSDGSIEQAGDAAREAGRKSEGFSGELAMMKNNAMSLANAMASGATPVVKDLGDKFKWLADAVNGMPDEMKTLAVMTAGVFALAGPAGVWAGTTVNAFRNVAAVVGALSRGMLEGGLQIQGFAMQMTANAGRVTKAATAVNGLGKAVQLLGSTGGMLAAAGVSIAVMAIVDAYVKAQDRAEKFSKATDGLRDAAQRARDVVKNASGSLEEYGDKASSSAMSVDELRESQASLADAMNERAESAETEIGQLQNAKKVIDRYTNEDLSDNIQAQGELRAAIDLVNEKLGTHYQVLDAAKGKLGDENGALLDSVESINTYIAAKERQIRADQLAADYADQSAAVRDAGKAYKEASEAVREFEDAHNSQGYTEGDLALLATLEGKADEAKALMDAAQESLDTTAYAMGELASQTDGAAESFRSLAVSSLAWQFEGRTSELDAFATQLEQCGLTVDDFRGINDAAWSDIIVAWNHGNGDLAEILSSMGVSVRSVGEQFGEELKAAGGDVEGFERRARDVSGGVEEFARMLSDSGISAQQFAQMGIEGFDNLWAAADGDITGVVELLATLDDADLKPKLFHVEDDGSLTYEGERIADLNAIEVEDKSFEVNADGTITFNEESLNDLNLVMVDDKIYRVSDNDTSKQLDEETQKLDDEEVEDKEYEADDDGTTEEAIEETQKLDDEEVEDKEFKVTANTADASKALQDIIDKLVWISEHSSQSVTVTTYKEDVRCAAGGVSRRDIAPAFASGAVARSIRSAPRHASGAINGIVARPTLTNIGWTGEAGAEAILHMRNAGGAVIPLSNRHYVRPFARAVAAEMGGAGNRTVNVTVNLAYDAGADAQAMTRDIADRLEAALDLEA